MQNTEPGHQEQFGCQVYPAGNPSPNQSCLQLWDSFQLWSLLLSLPKAEI